MSRPSFRAIGAPLEVSDAALEKLNERLGVPALITPAPKPSGIGQEGSEDAGKPALRPYPTRKTEKRITEQIPARAPSAEVRLAVNVPIYLRDAVNLRAAQERCTSRHLVMQGLQALGFDIDPADMAVDGRQPSPKA
jgi:hypothetical protein